MFVTFGQARRFLEPYIHPIGIKLTKEEQIQRAFYLFIVIVCVLMRLKKRAPKLFNTFVFAWAQMYRHKTVAQLLSVQHLTK